MLDALDPEQRAVAEAVTGPVVVWAGAGTGKTRAITHRIAHAVTTGAQDPRRGLAVTFTTRAAAEMRDRLRLLGVEGVQARTFHSAALRQLRHFWPRVVGGSVPEILGRNAPVVAEACSRVGVSPDPAVVRDLCAEIAWAKQTQVTAGEYSTAAAHRAPPTSLADAAAVYAAYDDLKWARGAMDFDDVLLLSVGMLQDRPDVLDEVRAAYRWFTVDEFQDVSPVQARLLDLWLGDRDDVCVVGDPAQTIYTFAGATDRFLREFPQRYPEAVQVRLFRAYRSTEPIIGLANRLLVAGAGGPAAGGALVSVRGEGPVPAVEAHADEADEARSVARAIERLHGAGTPWRDVAVLVRINAQMPVFEEALADRGIPVVLRGGERFFDRPEVREAITRLRGAARAEAASSATLGEEVASVLSAMGFTAQAPRGTGAVRERWESLASLAALAEEVERSATDIPATLRGFVDELDRRAESQHAPLADAVTLATIHAAKGLEWDCVFVPGMSEGSLPHSQASSSLSGIAEERRLLYVALTRARTQLSLSWARGRAGSTRASRSPSRFLAELEADLGAVDTDAVATAPRSTRRGRRAAASSGRGSPARCTGCGVGLVTGAERARLRCRRCPSSASPELLELLRDWRLARSRERGVPAYVIFTDATLEALAETRPSDDEALLSISGIGPDKLSRYGAELIALLAAESGDTPVA